MRPGYGETNFFASYTPRNVIVETIISFRGNTCKSDFAEVFIKMLELWGRMLPGNQFCSIFLL